MATGIPASQVVAITRREILNIPSAPVILFSADNPPLQSEFRFLKEKGKISNSGSWENVAAGLSYDGLGKVMGEPSRYEINTFNYQP